MIIFWLLICAAAAILLVKCRLTVAADCAVLLLRNGRRAVLYKGSYWINPLTDRTHVYDWRAPVPPAQQRKVTQLPLTEQIWDFPTRLLTRDGRPVNVTAVLYFTVTDPLRIICLRPDELKKLVKTILCRQAEETDSVTFTPQNLAPGLCERLQGETAAAGLNITRVECWDDKFIQAVNASGRN